MDASEENRLYDKSYHERYKRKLEKDFNMTKVSFHHFSSTVPHLEQSHFSGNFGRKSELDGTKEFDSVCSRERIVSHVTFFKTFLLSL